MGTGSSVNGSRTTSRAEGGSLVTEGVRVDNGRQSDRPYNGSASRGSNITTTSEGIDGGDEGSITGTEESRDITLSRESTSTSVDQHSTERQHSTTLHDDSGASANDDQTNSIPAPPMTTVSSHNHIKLIDKAFESLSTEFGVYFEIDHIVSTAGVFHTDPSTVIIKEGSEPSGIYIIVDGTYSQLIPDHTEISTNTDRCGPRLGELTSGDMFGELATLTSIPNIETIKCEESGTLIKVPFKSVMNNISGKVLTSKTRSWCVRRAHIYTSGLFDNNALVLLITMSGIKSTRQFSEWSHESIEYMSRLCQLTLFDSNEYLYKVDDPPSHLFIMIKGRVREGNENGQKFDDISVKSTNESCCVGHKDFFLKQARRQTAISLSPLLVIPLNREIILSTVEEFVDEKAKLQVLMKEYILIERSQHVLH